MATSKLMLNKARRLNDGTYPLVMQLLHLRKKRVIYSGIYLYPDEFDEQMQQMVSGRLHFRRQKEMKQKRELNGCKIGNPNDAGLYFRNGSLVGWKGGSDGSGVGMGSPSLSISVIPANYIIPLFWKFTSYHNGSGFDVNIASGLGDPCQYYLGGGWRTPSRAEFSALKFSNYSFYLTSNGVYAGATSSTANIMQGIFFPASGKRNQDSGVLEEANKEGAYLTSDSYNNNNNWGLWFNSNISARVDNWWRKRAYPVRCVTSYL